MQTNIAPPPPQSGKLDSNHSWTQSVCNLEHCNGGGGGINPTWACHAMIWFQALSGSSGMRTVSIVSLWRAACTLCKWQWFANSLFVGSGVLDVSSTSLQEYGCGLNIVRTCYRSLQLHWKGSTIFIKTLLPAPSPDVTPSGWLGSEHQLINSFLLLFLCFLCKF